ncbi:putative NADP-dependent aldehyde dehydrogenase [Rhizobium freirei PRF 81]|uniref:Putative NADP-dependent aldehyde dehydrogenase n=1 Tax=Rhizobium freirei PRF 81 TaxID=363754 RepID=N6UT04_9HYPH|nr:putative NADP-dependent aldehyde dehydrogenase [Rhizobium tropici CIAT 899]ENN83926.1 putative NADP-dependent aldehyde dehydrogenase [Rhizobium freirei PRF 81]
MVRCGGRRIGAKGTFFEATVITNVVGSMRIAQEETFGPLAPIIRYDDPEQVIREANDTIYGLAAYFYASNLKRVWRVAEAHGWHQHWPHVIGGGTLRRHQAVRHWTRRLSARSRGLSRNEVPLHGRPLTLVAALQHRRRVRRC